jgi:adenylosuccinate lyase
MHIDPLEAISPVDGRYRKATEELAPYFSESALIRYRVLVEVEYFILLNEKKLKGFSVSLDEGQKSKLRDLYLNFTLEDALTVKNTEKTTNHDVKAVEYFIKDKMQHLGMEELKEFVHFGLTSQDINNTAIPLSLREAMDNVYLPVMRKTVKQLEALQDKWKDISMLARTHGQPASPTKLGKEIKVFTERLTNQIELLEKLPHAAKFGGATGNFNAHFVAYPAVNWVEFANHFVNNKLGLSRTQYTTQIEPYDNMAAIFDNIKRINNILIDLCRDMWTYISMDYFKQELKTGEVGSSAMPHKVNPIDFENSEGNLGYANSILEHLSSKLPVSRLQRDLTDSTVLRNIGMPLAHTLIAIKSLQKGLGKLLLNEKQIEADLANNWAVVAEAIQTILRREGYPQPYEKLKDLTRTNSRISEENIRSFISTLDVSDEIKSELNKLSPFNYTGVY